MPPPPPPSKSYLLVLDSDSSDDEDSSHRRSSEESKRAEQYYYDRNDAGLGDYQQQLQEMMALQQQQQKTSSNPEKVEQKPAQKKTPENRIQPPPVVASQEEQKDSDDDDEDISAIIRGESTSNDSNSPQSKAKANKKRNKNKKKRQNKKKQAQAKAYAACKHVSFSDEMRIRSFPRCFGEDTVPSDGGWPLGMDTQFAEEQTVSMEEYLVERQHELHERWQQIKCKVVDEAALAIMEKLHGGKKVCDGDSVPYETRQWEFKRGIRNPLFRALDEDERRAIFLEDEEDGSSPPSSPSMTSISPSRRTRSNSVAQAPQVYSDKYDQIYVDRARNELEQIRIQRTEAGAVGCNCRKLHVYLPPTDGSGGKKAQHRRLKPNKVVQELKKRNVYDEVEHPKLSRDELEHLLHDTVEKEPCCWGVDCFCSRNGIQCQADTCSCWHSSHQVVSSHNDKGASRKGRYVDVLDIQGRCGNTEGMYVVDIDAIDEFRSQKLLICQPVNKQ